MQKKLQKSDSIQKNTNLSDNSQNKNSISAGSSHFKEYIELYEMKVNFEKTLSDLEQNGLMNEIKTTELAVRTAGFIKSLIFYIFLSLSASITLLLIFEFISKINKIEKSTSRKT